MTKIQLENNEWFDLDECVGEYRPDSVPIREHRYNGMIIYKTKKGNFITKHRASPMPIYKKSTQKEIDLYNNRYTFPPEEEQ